MPQMSPLMWLPMLLMNFLLMYMMVTYMHYLVTPAYYESYSMSKKKLLPHHKEIKWAFKF
nr:TPA_asm: ATP synthase F0 subunit 8 [Pseudomyrmex concolor]